MKIKIKRGLRETIPQLEIGEFGMTAGDTGWIELQGNISTENEFTNIVRFTFTIT